MLADIQTFPWGFANGIWDRKENERMKEKKRKENERMKERKSKENEKEKNIYHWKIIYITCDMRSLWQSDFSVSLRH